MALLGEMTLLPGGRIIMLKIPSKSPNMGTYTDNILFGFPYDEEPDLDVLEDGYATEIGARGVNLSGSQKASSGLYVSNKFVLLDEPLSPDSHTARFLFEHCAIHRVKWNIYNSYLRASSYWIWSFSAFAVLVGQVLSAGEKRWIKFDSQLRSPSGLFCITGPNAVEHPLFYVAVYAGIGLATAFMSLFCGGAIRRRLASLPATLQATPRISRPRYIPFPRYNSSRWVKFPEFAQDECSTVLASTWQTVNSSVAGFFASSGSFNKFKLFAFG
ncbi:hypothetical protein C8J57DRAFT_1523379 [Mycena rebaudengoi]|nr:hypothetical protein C8J57DRAFT_1523379 [Mycena rebaudengoi]